MQVAEDRARWREVGLCPAVDCSRLMMMIMMMMKRDKARTRFASDKHSPARLHTLPSTNLYARIKPLPETALNVPFGAWRRVTGC
jgi:hypothetical protein